MSADAAPAADAGRPFSWDPPVYEVLRRMAARRLRARPPCPTLEPSVLVHEVYLRLARAPVVGRSRAAFLGLAARVMRQVLIDHLRRRSAGKRGGGLATVPIDAVEAAAPADSDVTGVREALRRLERDNPRHARVVRLRYYDGLTIKETAQRLERSPATVKREWELARAWLRRELTAAAAG